MTPLHYACKSNNEDIAALLLTKGADVKAKSRVGYTPVDMAKGRIKVWKS